MSITIKHNKKPNLPICEMVCDKKINPKLDKYELTKFLNCHSTNTRNIQEKLTVQVPSKLTFLPSSPLSGVRSSETWTFLNLFFQVRPLAKGELGNKFPHQGSSGEMAVSWTRCWIEDFFCNQFTSDDVDKNSLRFTSLRSSFWTQLVIAHVLKQNYNQRQSIRNIEFFLKRNAPVVSQKLKSHEPPLPRIQKFRKKYQKRAQLAICW